VRLVGVDFSGAEGGGRAKIRLVERSLDDPEAPIRSGGRADRERLRRLILDSLEGEPSLWRIDAPFSLPIETLAEHSIDRDWLTMARWMREFGSPRGWRTALREASRREPRRACDRAFGTPMAPMNLRVFKQTWTLVADLLLPLAEAGASIEPVHRTRSPATIVEGCPASVLRAKEWPVRGYKGGGDPPRERRREILTAVRREGVRVPTALAREAIEDEEGDLLDAILLATDPFQGPPPVEASVEAWIF